MYQSTKLHDVAFEILFYDKCTLYIILNYNLILLYISFKVIYSQQFKLIGLYYKSNTSMHLINTLWSGISLRNEIDFFIYIYIADFTPGVLNHILISRLFDHLFQWPSDSSIVLDIGAGIMRLGAHRDCQQQRSAVCCVCDQRLKVQVWNFNRLIYIYIFNHLIYSFNII